MKANAKNNPVTVGALLGVLGATLFFLMRQMGGGGSTPVATLTPVVDTHEDAALRLTQTGASAVAAARDPFDHPALRRAAKTGADAQDQNTPGLTPQAQEAARLTPPGSAPLPLSAAGQAGLMPSPSPLVPQAALPRATAQAASTSATSGAGGSRAGASPASMGNAPAGVQEADDPLKGWRLTAIIAGRTPRAVIEGAGKAPTLVGVGGRVSTLCVTAIQEREIVLSDAHHLYTLPLTIAPASPEDNKGSDQSSEKQNDKPSDVSKDIPAVGDILRAAGSKISDKTDTKDSSKNSSKDSNKDMTAEAILNAARETLNATAKKHP